MKIVRKLIVFALLISPGACASAQHTTTVPSPYAGEEEREIKALSADEISRYRKGDGMGLAKAAELNHFPGPRHVIDLADELHLTDTQRRQIQMAFDEMHTAAVALGEKIIEHEATLDRLFAGGNVEAGAMRDVLRAIGALQADLRFVHLNAHLATRSALTDAQVSLYDELRGYAEAQGAEHEHSNMNH